MVKSIRFINYFSLILSAIVSIIWGFVSVFVYFILAASLLIYFTIKTKGISRYIKIYYPDIYEKRRMLSRMTMEGDFAVNILKLTEIEINSLADKKIASTIWESKALLRDIIISFTVIVIISISKHYW